MTNSSVKSSVSRDRLVQGLRAAIIHLVCSLAVAGLVAALVFGYWFPTPLRELVGGADLFWMVVGADVVCGPLLTLIVFNPAKPRAELRRDLASVALIQVIALGYGVHTLSYARPLALVHEVDRFRVVTYADLDAKDAHNAPEWAQPLRLSRPRTLGIRSHATSEEMLESIERSFQGIEPSQRPSWWQDYAISTAQVLRVAKPVSALRAKHQEEAALINVALETAMADAEVSETTDPTALRWLPLVSRRATDWVVLIDPVTARVRGYAHLDGF